MERIQKIKTTTIYPFRTSSIPLRCFVVDIRRTDPKCASSVVGDAKLGVRLRQRPKNRPTKRNVANQIVFVSEELETE
jgi:hypothetical protein